MNEIIKHLRSIFALALLNLAMSICPKSEKVLYAQAAYLLTQAMIKGNNTLTPTVFRDKKVG